MTVRYLGIDVGGTAVKIGIVDDQGAVLCKDSYAVDFDGYKTPILDTVLKSTDTFLAGQGMTAEEIAAVGISATGQIDTLRGVVIGSAGHIQNWLGAEVKSAFEEKYGKRTAVINDANAVALGEQWVGRAAGYRNVVVVTIGTGVGGGVIVDGHLLSGKLGIAGELGHFMINNDGEPCSCGNRGCYERYASMSALVRKVKAALPELGLPLKEEDVNGKSIFQWYWKRETGIAGIVDAWIGTIADGLIGLTHIFNPEIILIGGGVSKEGERFLNLVREKVLKGVMPRFADGLVIEATSLGNDAGLVGAVKALF